MAQGLKKQGEQVEKVDCWGTMTTAACSTFSVITHHTCTALEVTVPSCLRATLTVALCVISSVHSVKRTIRGTLFGLDFFLRGAIAVTGTAFVALGALALPAVTQVTYDTLPVILLLFSCWVVAVLFALRGMVRANRARAVSKVAMLACKRQSVPLPEMDNFWTVAQPSASVAWTVPGARAMEAVCPLPAFVAPAETMATKVTNVAKEDAVKEAPASPRPTRKAGLRRTEGGRSPQPSQKQRGGFVRSPLRSQLKEEGSPLQLSESDMKMKMMGA